MYPSHDISRQPVTLEAPIWLLNSFTKVEHDITTIEIEVIYANENQHITPYEQLTGAIKMPQDLPPLLQVREMKHSDIPSTAELLTLAPDDGALYQFPHIQQFPDDMWSLHARELRRMLLIRTLLIRIAFVPVGSEGWERIVGFIVWSRRVERGEKSVDGYFCGLEEWRDGDLVDGEWLFDRGRKWFC